MKISFKSLLSIVGAFIEKLFGGAKKFSKFLTDHIDDAIDLIGKVRKLIESDEGAVTMDLLPEKWKSRIDEANIILGKVLTHLSVGEECLRKDTIADRLQCLVDYFSTKTGVEKAGMYLKVAVLWVKYTSGTDQKESALDTAVQNRVFATKNNLLEA